MHNDAIAAYPPIDDVRTRADRLCIERQVIEVGVFREHVPRENRKALGGENEREERCKRFFQMKNKRRVVGRLRRGNAVVPIPRLHVVRAVVDRVNRPNAIARRQRTSVGKTHALVQMVGNR